MESIKAMSGYVIVDRIENEVAESGLLVEANSDFSQTVYKGIIMSSNNSSTILAGDTILFKGSGSNKFVHEDKELVVVPEENIIATITKS